MKQTKDIEYIVLFRKGSAIHQVKLDGTQQIALQHLMGLIIDGKLKLGPELVARLANEKV